LPLASGNTEIFHGSILPRVLHSIEAFKGFFVHAKFCIKKGDIPVMTAEPRCPTCGRAVSADRVHKVMSAKASRPRRTKGITGAKERESADTPPDQDEDSQIPASGAYDQLDLFPMSPPTVT
jgi:hypothetical protein